MLALGLGLLAVVAGVANAQRFPIITPNTNNFRVSYRNVLNEPLDCFRGAGWYANLEDCNEYYRCHSWVRHAEESRFSIFRFRCGPGAVFSEKLLICVHPDFLATTDPDQQCGTPRQRVVTPAPTTTTTPAYDPTRCEAPGFFENPIDCTKFKQCRRARDGSIIGAEYDCPTNTVFNVDVPVCDDLENLRYEQSCLKYERDTLGFDRFDELKK